MSEREKAAGERARQEAERIFSKREDELSDLLIALADSAMSDLESYQQRAEALETWIQNMLATELEPLLCKWARKRKRQRRKVKP